VFFINTESLSTYLQLEGLKVKRKKKRKRNIGTKVKKKLKEIISEKNCPIKKSF